jgi:hypothetical protein
MPAMQVSRITRTRNASSSGPAISISGAMWGALPITYDDLSREHREAEGLLRIFYCRPEESETGAWVGSQ